MNEYGGRRDAEGGGGKGDCRREGKRKREKEKRKKEYREGELDKEGMEDERKIKYALKKKCT